MDDAAAVVGMVGERGGRSASARNSQIVGSWSQAWSSTQPWSRPRRGGRSAGARGAVVVVVAVQTLGVVGSKVLEDELGVDAEDVTRKHP